jgi:site-specific recombinase XerD
MLSQIEAFVKWVRRRNAEARTWRDYSYDLRQFVDVVGDREPAEITFRDIDRFVNTQVSRGFKPSTVNRRLCAVRAFYTYLAEEDPKLVCPVLPHRHHLREPQRLPRPVQEPALQKFFSVITDPRDRAMFTLMLRCGLRIGEVAHLKLADLFLDEPSPRLLVHGKGSRERSVFLSAQAERSLRAYLQLRPAVASDFVFLSYQQKGLSTTGIHMRLVRYRVQAAVQLSAHRLRHSFGRPFGRLVIASVDAAR